MNYIFKSVAECFPKESCFNLPAGPPLTGLKEVLFVHFYLAFAIASIGFIRDAFTAG